MYRAKPTKPHELGDAARVLSIRLDWHRLEGVPDVTGLDQLHSKASGLHLGKEPLRERTRFQPDPCHRHLLRRKPGDQSLGLARRLRLFQDLAPRIDDANARVFQRDVDSGILLHGRPSMMLGAGESSTPLFNTITLRDGRQNPMGDRKSTRL